jgi:hypothetical protein
MIHPFSQARLELVSSCSTEPTHVVSHWGANLDPHTASRKPRIRHIFAKQCADHCGRMDHMTMYMLANTDQDRSVKNALPVIALIAHCMIYASPKDLIVQRVPRSCTPSPNRPSCNNHPTLLQPLGHTSALVLATTAVTDQYVAA